ncbi:hypothetical protein LJR230_002829 [Trinickia sp. LjRoot230]|uniref:BspC domain-containing protein n=1 Tax=Trinickia sp. LjRoot230 TaxID=3342288 RepID=UPI003ECDBE96
MDSSNTSRRLRQLVRWLTAAVASLPLALPARADLIDDRNEMVAKFINEMHADPLVADCAAHGQFVASTSSVIERVEFPPDAFDSAHASIKPWNEPFDEGKQRVKVDNVVTVDGQGIARDKNRAPYALTFRCGYVGSQMLAFNWNDPVPSAKPRAERSTKKGKTKHGAKTRAVKKSTNQ